MNNTANAYAIDKGDEKQKKFQYALQTIGFNVKLKPYISRSDGSSKGDWDVGITIDILDSAEKAEKIILLSGDGDFDLLLQKVINKHGCIVHLWCKGVNIKLIDRVSLKVFSYFK